MQAYSSMTPAPVSVDWSQHLSEEGSLRQLASLRVLLSTFSGIPGVVGLHGGLPAADAFPFTEMSFTLRDGSKVVVNDPVQVSSCLPPPTSVARLTQAVLMVTSGSGQPPGSAGLAKPIVVWLPGLRRSTR